MGSAIKVSRDTIRSIARHFKNLFFVSGLTVILSVGGYGFVQIYNPAAQKIKNRIPASEIPIGSEKTAPTTIQVRSAFRSVLGRFQADIKDRKTEIRVYLANENEEFSPEKRLPRLKVSLDEFGISSELSPLRVENWVPSWGEDGALTPKAFTAIYGLKSMKDLSQTAISSSLSENGPVGLYLMKFHYRKGAPSYCELVLVEGQALSVFQRGLSLTGLNDSQGFSRFNHGMELLKLRGEQSS
jgi:hypothetical protein